VPEALQSAQQPFAVESGQARQAGMSALIGNKKALFNRCLRIVRLPLPQRVESTSLRIVSSDIFSMECQYRPAGEFKTCRQKSQTTFRFQN
jgi:hypothetical protein